MKTLEEARESREKRKLEACERPITVVWMSERAAKLWDDLAPLMFGRGLLEPLFHESFAILCTALAEVQELEEYVAAHGRTYTTGEGKERIHPMAAMLPASRKMACMYLAEFGLTPESYKTITGS